MSATGYEETDLSYHVPDDEDYEREENGEEEEDEESVRKPAESDARAFREESMRDLREDGCREVREQSASPPRDEEGNVRLQAGQHHVAENRGSAPDDERVGGVACIFCYNFYEFDRTFIIPGHPSSFCASVCMTHMDVSVLLCLCSSIASSPPTKSPLGGVS